MRLPNTEANIISNTDDLHRRLLDLNQVRQLNGRISPIDQFILHNLRDITVGWEMKIAQVGAYQAAGNDTCLLRAVEIALDHIRGKNLLTLNDGRLSYSLAASASSYVMPLAGFFRNRGIDKQRQRLAQIDGLVSLIENRYQVARLMHRFRL